MRNLPPRYCSQHTPPATIVPEGFDPNETIQIDNEIAWFAYLLDLGLSPERISHEVSHLGKTYYPNFWLNNWNTFVYVLPEKHSWNAAAQETYDEAKELAEAMQVFDVVVVIGAPCSNYDNVVLLSHVLNVWFENQGRDKPLDQHKWTIAGVFDVKYNAALCWTLLSDEGDVFVPQDQQWCGLCDCNQRTCDDCSDFKIFYPFVTIGDIAGRKAS